MKPKSFTLLLTALLLAPLARGATVTVTNAADSGAGSLRHAIASAAPGDTIAFSSTADNGAVNFHDGAAHTIALTSAQLLIDKSLTISAPGASVLTVRRDDAAPSFRIFAITSGTTAVIAGMTIGNGRLDSLGTNEGAGLRNEGVLTISNSVVSRNSAIGVNHPTIPNLIGTSDNEGGGIWNSGTLTVTDSTVTNNSAEGARSLNRGGGIFGTYGASLTVIRSTISSNRIGGNEGYNLGGGIYDEGSLTITSSTLMGNSTSGLGSPDFGGGLYKYYGGRITNSTIAGNSSGGGGGIHYGGGLGLDLRYCTIVGNTSRGYAGGIQSGAAAYDFGTAAHCIIAGNFASHYPDTSGEVRSNGHNLIGSTEGTSGWVASDLQNVDPLLGPLQDNGGPTFTMAPLPGSPVIDAGDPAINIASLSTDQRGYVRIKGAAIDLGAVESGSYLNAPPVANAGTPQPVRAGASVQLTGSESYDDNTANANLSFAWSFVSKPANSGAGLSNANTAMPSFTPDVAGEYVVQLIVTDNEYPPLSSAPATVSISSFNQAPTAVASANPQLPAVGQVVVLSSTGSNDPENDALVYRWELMSKPMGSVAAIVGANQATATFVPDKAGDYNVRLTPADFLGDGEPVSITVTASVPMGAADHLRAASAGAEALTGNAITSTGNQNAFTGFIQQALKDMQKGQNAKAIQAIDKAIERADGFPLRGAVDQQGPSRDWILSQPAQMSLCGHLTAARALLATP